MLYLGDMQTREASTTYSNGSTTSERIGHQGIHTVVTNFINDLSKLYSEITTSKTKSTQSSFKYISTQLTENNSTAYTYYTILTSSSTHVTTNNKISTYTKTSYTEHTISESFNFSRVGSYDKFGGIFNNIGSFTSRRTRNNMTEKITAVFRRSYVESSSSKNIRTSYNINL